VHKEASLRITTLCRDALLESGAITVQDVLRVMNTVSDASDIKRDDLDTILAALQFQIAEMKAAKAVTNDTKEEIKP
jgi:CBS-domain-containing membrane protein